MSLSSRPAGAYHLTAWRPPRPIGVLRRSWLRRRLLVAAGTLLALAGAVAAGCLAALVAPPSLPAAQPPVSSSQPAPAPREAERPTIELRGVAAAELNHAVVRGLEQDFHNPELARRAALRVRRLEAGDVWLEIELQPDEGAPSGAMITSTVIEALQAHLAGGTRVRVTCLNHLGDRLAERTAQAADKPATPDSYEIAITP